MAPSGGIPFGNYTLLKRLARGGMAEVFVARQAPQGGSEGMGGWGRRVAVKRILPHLADSPEFTRMFLAEAKVAARLAHPNIVHIYDVGKVEDDFFIAMEFVDGVHGAQLIQHPERLPPSLLARIGADAAAALHYAHTQDARVVHRDVSPHNLMVSFDGVVKLVDFGIAKALGAGEQTRPGVVKGKYAYMSPEQAMGRALDGKSDVFSLGLVLWELAAGRYAFERGDSGAVMRAIRDGRVPSLEAAAPGLPAALAEAIRWALARDPEQRPTAAELGAALEAFVKSQPDMATSMELATWVRARFDRGVTADLPAMTEAVPAAGTHATQIASSTHATPVTRAPVPSSTAAPVIAPRTPARDDGTGDPTRVDVSRPAPPAIETEAALTALVATPPPERRHRGWIAASALATIGLGAGVFVIATRGGDEARAPAPIASAPIDAAAAPAPDATALAITPIAPIDAALPPDAPPAPAPAALVVTTTPDDATAIVAGQRLPTPATFEGLAPGTVALHVEAPGYVSVDRELPLAPGERRTFELHLVRKPDTHEAPAPRVGFLNARTTPYSEVYDGARHLGQTPFADVRLSAGAHTLTFKNPGKRPVTRRVTIRAGQTTKLAFDLP